MAVFAAMIVGAAGAGDDGDGVVTTPSARGMPLVELTATFVVSIHDRRRKDHTLHQSNVVPPRHIRRRRVAAMCNAMPRERPVPVPLRRVRRGESASLPESSNGSCARPRRLESRCSRRWRGRWLRLRRGCDALLRRQAAAFHFLRLP